MINNSLVPPSIDHLSLQLVKRKLPFSSYWGIAQTIIEKTGIRNGNFLEINGDNCFLGVAMTQLTGMQIYLMENSKDIMNHLAFQLKQNCMEKEVTVVKGSPLKIPVEDGQIHLVVFRKSIFNWRSPQKTFQEIYRILTPGGIAYLGDDSWNGQKWNSIENKLKDYGIRLSEQLNGDIWRNRLEKVREKIIQAGIQSFEMVCNGEGLQIIIRRPEEQKKYLNQYVYS